jgi:hypothetical protein
MYGDRRLSDRYAYHLDNMGNDVSLVFQRLQQPGTSVPVPGLPVSRVRLPSHDQTGRPRHPRQPQQQLCASTLPRLRRQHRVCVRHRTGGTVQRQAGTDPSLNSDRTRGKFIRLFVHIHIHIYIYVYMFTRKISRSR